MSDPQRTRVRVRRSPKISVFLLIGVALGVLAAVIAVNVTPADATISKPQAIGALLVVTIPIGAVILGVLALVLDRIAEHRAKEVDAELVSTLTPTEAHDPEAAAPEVAEQPAGDRGDPSA